MLTLLGGINIFMVYYFRQWLFCLKHYTQMSVFASGPDRLPHSLPGVLITVFCYFLLGFALVNEQRGFSTLAIQILFELLLLALLVLAGLKWKSRLSRFLQTYSALVGVNLVISVVTLLLLQLFGNDGSAEPVIEGRVLYLTMLIIFWNLAVLSQILKLAFDINTVMSALIVINYFVLYQFTVIWF
ncbi:MAG: hypothetical protein GY784_03050 [Gammaproteobacteria bacterium]|nr:hypothetical protein [Gammaproteobacteria bacterium]